MGYPYETSAGRGPLDSPSLTAIRAWEHLRKGKRLDAEDVKKVYKFMRPGPGGYDPAKAKSLSYVDKRVLLNIQDLTDNHGLLTQNIWHETLSNITPQEREFFIAARRRGESLVKEPRIKISTMHRVKGGEADNVVLLTDISMRTYNEMNRNLDDECRVFYVGATRAKNSLHIVMPQTDLFFKM
jgi:ATP-dependent exoDNAse (exonuclease V) beta subunit